MLATLLPVLLDLDLLSLELFFARHGFLRLGAVLLDCS